jgi:hypothetical protein
MAFDLALILPTGDIFDSSDESTPGKQVRPCGRSAPLPRRGIVAKRLLLREADNGIPWHVAQLSRIGLRYVCDEPHRRGEAVKSLCSQQR